MLFALVYIDSILQPAKRLLVQFHCLSFYKYISLVIVRATHDRNVRATRAEGTSGESLVVLYF